MIQAFWGGGGFSLQVHHTRNAQHDDFARALRGPANGIRSHNQAGCIIIKTTTSIYITHTPLQSNAILLDLDVLHCFHHT
jgi:hypothetical protein